MAHDKCPPYALLSRLLLVLLKRSTNFAKQRGRDEGVAVGANRQQMHSICGRMVVPSRRCCVNPGIVYSTCDFGNSVKSQI